MPETSTDSANKLEPHDDQTLNSSDENVNLPEEDDTIRFFPVAEGKLITLYIASFGLYGVYWFYKNWKLQQPVMDKKISPVWRSIFAIFFTHALFRRIDQAASHLDRKHRFTANTLATAYVATIVISSILDQLTSANLFDVSTQNGMITISLLLFFLSAYPLVRAQATINRINNDILGYLNYKYSPGNYALVALGVILWILFALGTLSESINMMSI